MYEDCAGVREPIERFDQLGLGTIGNQRKVLVGKLAADYRACLRYLFGCRPQPVSGTAREAPGWPNVRAKS